MVCFLLLWIQRRRTGEIYFFFICCCLLFVVCCLFVCCLLLKNHWNRYVLASRESHLTLEHVWIEPMTQVSDNSWSFLLFFSYSTKPSIQRFTCLSSGKYQHQNLISSLTCPDKETKHVWLNQLNKAVEEASVKAGVRLTPGSFRRP